MSFSWQTLLSRILNETRETNPVGLPVDLKVKLAGEDQDNDLLVTTGQWALTVIPATAGEYATAGPDRLHALWIAVAGAADSTISLYDGTSAAGALIQTWTGGAAGLVLVPVGIDADFPTKLTVKTTAGSGAAPKVGVASFVGLVVI